LLESYGVQNKLTDSDIMPIASTSAHKPDVVIFSGTGPKTSEPLSKKLQGKAFMVRSFLLSYYLNLTLPRLKSSKVSKLRDETQEQKGKDTADATDDEDDEL
jgi:hypothetical protein